MSLRWRRLNLLIALDQLAWVILTIGKGYPDETISAASALRLYWYKAKPTI